MMDCNYTDPMAITPDFETSTGFLLSQLGVAATRSWSRMLSDFDLTPHHHAVLLALDQMGEVALGELARVISVDARNMGPVLDPLERQELIARQYDPVDRRRRAVSLTGAGRARARQLAAAAANIEEDFLRALDPTQRANLRQLLEQLWRSLDR
jgi:DNA-binding MarR family transcriptional regulator